MHKLTKNRERENNKKELRIKYLIEAWTQLEFASNRTLNGQQFIDHVEKPIASIQLFGTPKQIELAQQVAANMAKERQSNLDLILNDLRNDLRLELNLEKAKSEVKYIRFKN
ncbi:MAG TPA: hypothetical protein DIU20_05380 [Cryomorphaceae bacterium]|nr:hypothetical protein [Cryomorphaceae bacterium]